MDELQVVEQVSPAKKEAENFLAQADRAEITNMENCGLGGEMAKHMRDKRTDLDTQRTTLVKPLNDHVKFINGQFNPVIAIYKKAEGVIKGKMGIYMAAEEERQRVEAEAARKKAEDEAIARAEELQEAGDEETAEAVLETVAETANKAPERVQATGSMGAKSSTRKTWTYDVEKEHEIPREFLMINDKAVKAYIQGGARDIPGLKIYQKTSVQVR